MARGMRWRRRRAKRGSKMTMGSRGRRRQTRWNGIRERRYRILERARERERKEGGREGGTS